MQSIRYLWVIAFLALAFVTLAVTGSYLTTRHMNQTAIVQESSAGRSGEPQPNTLQDQQSGGAARAPSTTGAGTGSGGSAPPASR